MWASGHYDRVAREIIPVLGERLVASLGITAGERVLDIAAGTGNAAVPAARAGAAVVASDLTPELLDIGRAEHPDARHRLAGRRRRGTALARRVVRRRDEHGRA